MRKDKRTTIFVLIFLLYTIGYSYDINSVVSPNFIFETLALNKDIETAAWPKYSSPTDLVPSNNRKKLFVAEQTAKSIAIIDVESKKVEKKIQLPNEVTGIAVSPDDTRLYATCSSELWPDGFVAVVDIGLGKVTGRIGVGPGARSPNISPDGKTLYVCNMFDNDVSVVDLVSKKEKKRIKVIREPVSSAITPDGKTLVVANSLPHEIATDSLTITNKVQLINTAEGKVSKTIPLTIGSHSAFGVTVDPSGKYALVTHLIGMFNHEATKVGNGWIHTNNLALIDIDGKTIVNDVSLDAPEIGAANPFGVKISDDGKFGAVALSGSNELFVFDFPKFVDVVKNAKGSLSASFTTFADVDDKKIWVDGKAPRAVTIIDDLIYIAGYFSDTVLTYSLDTKTSAAGRKIQDIIVLQESPRPLTSHRMGEYRFFDASLCEGTWQSCHSCHPFGRPDGLNWILNNSQKTPKNAKTMLYSWWTPRTGWAGKRDNAYSSVRFGIKEELFMKVVDERLAISIDSFLVRMKPVPSPYLVKGKLSEKAKKGREIYYDRSKVNCIVCHPAPLFTDLKFHVVNFPDPWDATREWDTPPLHESWRTAPYNHIGSSETMEECIVAPGHSNVRKSDGTPNLTSEEIECLVEYVLSL